MPRKNSNMRLKLSEIRENPHNPRVIADDNFKKLVKSIIDFPDMLEARPIVVNEDMMVIGGNMRLRACKEAGLEEAPVFVARWKKEKNPEFIIKDNVGYGDWDWDLLANEWDQNELIEWGLDIDWEADEEGADEISETPEIPETPKTKLGDLYELVSVESGITHQVQCGDSRGIIPSVSAFAFNDAPFDNDSILSKVFKNCKQATGLQFWIGSDRQVLSLCREFIDDFSRFFVHDFKIPTLISNKREMQLHALIPMFGRGDFNNMKQGFSSIIRVASERTIKNRTGTPMSKRVELPEVFILHFSKKGDCISDMFLHSGSTLIACEKNSRKCFGVEIETGYVDIAIKRWVNYMRDNNKDYKVLKNRTECFDFEERENVEKTT